MGNRRERATDEDREKFKKAVSMGKKKMRKNFSKEQREYHIRQLKENVKKGRENQTEEKKKAFSQKMSKIMKERRKDEKYRKHMSETVSAQMKRQRDSYSEEEKNAKRDGIINEAKKYRSALSEEEKKEYLNKMYQGRVAAAEEREKRGEIKWACQYPQCILGAKADSGENLKRGKIFAKDGYSFQKEFALGNYIYDFKIGNVLIEINPYAWHNSTWVPNIKGAKPKDKMYHYNKAKNAIDNGYGIIEVRDWTDETKVSSMIKEGGYKALQEPKLNRFNYKTGEHIVDDDYNQEEMVNKGYVEIWDAGF